MMYIGLTEKEVDAVIKETADKFYNLVHTHYKDKVAKAIKSIRQELWLEETERDLLDALKTQ